MAMICGYDLNALYLALSHMHPGRSPWTIEEELEQKFPHFCHLQDINCFLAHHGYMMGVSATVLDWEGGDRLELSPYEKHVVPVELPLSLPAIAGVDSENYEGKLHWVVWDGKNILDPNPKAPDKRPLSDFDGHIIDWYPIVKLEPWDES